ncbi:HAD-IIIC family phosphatase [Ruminococcaceae bacterium OttesenSCG-928-O06]|nr:HAD-IIIC family phosphatase [Ruminococcaceae bacterium OttesenSCG-928-O06]
MIDKKVAVLGGSTTQDVCSLLELFLLDGGIRPQFYQSEFGQYWQDAVFPPQALCDFAPDVVFVHTSLRNLATRPAPGMAAAEVTQMLDDEMARLTQMWQALAEQFDCPVIQNNFEPPFYRLMGNRDAWDAGGLTHYVHQLNGRLYKYAAAHPSFYIHDIHYLAAEYGLSRWADPAAWHLYKYALAPAAIPAFAANLSHIILSLYGRNKKALVMDLDNTLWGGVVGDDGVEGLEIGHETPMGEVFSEFQQYVKDHRRLGVVLAVNSKNQPENALAGLAHPEGTLREEDFAVVCANWQPKDRNLAAIADALNLGVDALAFVDDNPAERELVRQAGLGAAVPEVTRPEEYIHVLDQSGFFETTVFSAEDAARADMYRQNAQRQSQQAQFADYDAFLQSLAMRGAIRPFEPLYLPRITQLTNKSNQFNLTTRRYTENELQAMAENPAFICLYGKLEDRFGDNGVVSVVAAEAEAGALHIRLWLMSCRVLKRGMEQAMMDALAARAAARGIKQLVGYYYKTAKNQMVQDFYAEFGFQKVAETPEGDSEWRLELSAYRPQNRWIKVEEA